MRARVATVLFLTCFTPAQAVSNAQVATKSQNTGPEIYRSACAACHGPDGKGSSRSAVGFDTPLPNFTDCSFSSPEADADWIAIVHQGGTVRAFDRMMPAFGDALSAEDIERVVRYVRSLCTEKGWPRGELNLPRALVTEKAFPENEAVVTTSFSRDGANAIGNEFLYERRVGRRGQYEIIVPFDLKETATGQWRSGIGDIAGAYKHVLFDSSPRGSILSAGAEVVLPTGDEEDGLGEGHTVLEPFAAFGQILPRNAFLHLHGGFEIPIAADDSQQAAFWRAAVGKTFVQKQWHRAWSPMFELLGSRELADGEPVLWDVVPQLQVSLSTRQHILLNAGVRVPVNRRQDRGNTFMVYLLWDWFDGGFFSGW
jgi:mono/diheme cytochrome c family protein